MDTDWTEWDVLYSLRVVQPPGFMWVGDDRDQDQANQTTIIQRHWNEFVDLLDGGVGYDRLVTMRDRLEAHSEEVRGRIRPRTSRRRHAELVLEACDEMVLRLARAEAIGANADRAETARSDSDGDEVDSIELERAYQRLLGEPIAAAWVPSEEEAPAQRVDGAEEWKVVPKSADEGAAPTGSLQAAESPSAKSPSDLRVEYRPADEKLRREEIDPDHLSRSGAYSFPGETTWKDALALLRDRISHLFPFQRRFERTLELLQFRLAVVEVVLYRFEAFGSAEPLAAEEAEGFLDTTAEQIFAGRSRAEGEKTPVHPDVKSWAKQAFERFCFEEGLGVEEAKDEVLNAAMKHDYHFSRRSLARWVRP